MNRTIVRLVLVMLGLGMPPAWPSGRSVAQDPAAPRLPGEGTAPAAALLRGLPADAAEVYRPIPRDQDAAPAYLAALSEFDPMMADCWPEPERTRRKQLLADRQKRLNAVLDPADRQGMPIDAHVRDAILAEFRSGWAAIVQAQRRPRCRFAIAIGPAAATPHAFTTRQVERVARLMAAADLEKGDVDAALGRLAVVLRLSRDLRPGGNAICQISSVAIDLAACTDIALPVLRSPALRAEHCDRLIELARMHEREGLDPFRALLVPEALELKTMITMLQSDPKLRAQIVAMFRNDVPGALADLLNDLTGKRQPPADSAAPNRRAGDRLEAMTDADFTALLRAIDAYYSAWWRLDATTYDARVRAAQTLADRHLRGDFLLRALGHDARSFTTIAESAARDLYALRAAMALAAVRRWQLERGTLPPDLSTAARAAGLADAPGDPFAAAPLKLITVAGAPAVYSVGPDRKDDAGKRDAQLGLRREGDWITSLAEPAPGR